MNNKKYKKDSRNSNKKKRRVNTYRVHTSTILQILMAKAEKGDQDSIRFIKEHLMSKC